MQHLLALAELFYELLDAVLVIERLALGFGDAFIEKSDFEAGIQECQFAQALTDTVGFEFGRLLKNLRIRFERDEGAGAFGFADYFELLGGLAALEFHVMDLAIARNVAGEPFRDGIDALGADTMSAARISVSALAVLAT